MKKFLISSIIPVFMFGQNLTELIDLAQQNKLIQSSQMGLEALNYEYKSVQSSYMPSLSVGASYAHTNEETASIPDKARKAYASLDYVLYDGGKKYDLYDSYESFLKSQKKSLEALKNELALNVATLYYNYLTSQAAKTAKLKEINQIQAQYERLKNFLNSGMTTEDEVQKLVSQLQAQRVNLHQIELDMETILHNLKYLTGQKVQIDSGSKIQAKDFTSKSNRFDLEAMRYNLDGLKSQADAKKSAYLPTLILDNTYTYYDYDYKSNLYNQPVQDQNIVTLSLKWEIFDFFETKNAYASSFKRYLSNKYEYDYEQEKANTDLELSKRGYEIAKLKKESSQEALKAANLTYDVIKSKFENGLVDNVAYLDALSQKYDAQSGLQQAVFELESKKAEILYHSGEYIKEFVK